MHGDTDMLEQEKAFNKVIGWKTLLYVAVATIFFSWN